MRSYYKDWTTFPTSVLEFIEKYPAEDKGAYRLIPQRAITDFIKEKYNCTWGMAKIKLTALIEMRSDLSYVVLKSYDKGPFTKKPPTWKFVAQTKRLYR